MVSIAHGFNMMTFWTYSSWRLLVFGSDPPFIAVSQVLSKHNPQVILVEDNETSYGLQVGAIMLTGKVISRH